MRPAEISDDDIIRAGLKIAASGRPVTGSGIKTILGRGNVARCKRIWDGDVQAKEEAASLLDALPEQISREMETITTSLISDISRLAHRLNDLTIKDGRQQVVLGLASARQQHDALLQELEAAALALEDAEVRLDDERSERDTQTKLLAEAQERAGGLSIEVARLAERLTAAEAAGARVDSYQRDAEEARGQAASIAGRLQEAQEINRQLMANRG